MNRPDYPQYQLDFTGRSPFNKINQEHGYRNSVKNNDVMIPLQAPFYIDTVKLFHPNGEPMVKDVDYEFYGILGNLTAYTAKPVGLFIRLKKDSIKEWYIDYGCVGNFNKLTDEILNMLKSITQDDRPVDWDNIDNKPLWFIPKLHKHDYTFHFFGFTDLAKQLLRLKSISSDFPKGVEKKLEAFQSRLDSYIDSYQKVLFDLIDEHDAGRVDNHGVDKTDIGLEHVDNFKTATLTQATDGDRSDLHITVKGVAAAADLAGGRNQRLFPSGTLPILRYGSDTFIPPKIDGSFEGMGGENFRSGVCVESNGDLLVLQRRNNGKVKGLYFLRAQRWNTDRPIWEFTGYRYTHPTANAAGATLNAIIAGSNRHIMIVGDEDKNIWFWVETNGTFNPASHVLNRITSPEFLGITSAHAKMQILADKNYKEFNCVALACHESYVRVYRPSYPGQGGGAQSVNGWQIFTNINMDGRYVMSTIDHLSLDPGAVNYMDKMFVPFQNTIQNGKIIQCEFIPTVPLAVVWHYHTPSAFIAKRPDGKWSIYFEWKFYYVTGDYGNQGAATTCWRGTLSVTNGPTPVCKLERGPKERMYRLDPANLFGTVEGNEYYKYKTPPRDYAYGDKTSSIIFNGYRMWIISGNTFTIPLQLVVDQDGQYTDPERLVGNTYAWDYSQVNAITLNEVNPLGLTSGFMNQFVGVTNTEDWNTGMVMARVSVEDKEEQKVKGYSKWIARGMSILKSDWHGRWDNMSTIKLGGRDVKSYPFSNDVYEVDLGTSVVLSTHAVPEGYGNNTRKGTWANIFGADAFSFFLGKCPLDNPTAKGDGLLIHQNTTKLVGKTVVFQPTVVCKVDTAIMRDIAPMVKAAYPAADISNSWSLIQAWGVDNAPFYWLLCSYRHTEVGETDNLHIVLAPVFVNPKGTPVTKNGYSYYEDVTFQFIQPFTAPIVFYGALRRGSTAFGVENTTMRHSSVNIGSIRPEATGKPFTFILRSLHRWAVIGDEQMVDVMFETDINLKPLRVTRLGQASVAPEGTYIITPGNGFGTVSGNAMVTEGAGVVSTGFSYVANGNLYDAVTSDVKSETVLGMSNLLVSSYTIYFKEIKNVIIGGKSYDIPAGYLDLRSIDSNPANKAFYVYLRFKNGVPTYEVVKAVGPETPVNALIATVWCGPSQIDAINPYNRFTMVGVQISSVKQGSSIPAMLGSSYSIGDASAIMTATDWLPE